MLVTKRDGREVPFCKEKIVDAISKANDEAKSSGVDHLSPIMISAIASELYAKFKVDGHAIAVEDIQDAIEMALMQKGYYDVAKIYIRYRYERQLYRNGNTTDGKILAIVDGSNETVIQENSNKNPKIARHSAII